MQAAARVNLGRTLVGLALVVVGGLFLLDQLNVADFGQVFSHWWPVAIIALGLLELAMNPRAPIGPLIVVGVGAVLLLATVGVLNTTAGQIFWPLVIIAIGAFVILSRGAWFQRAGAAEDSARSFVAFGGNELVSHSPAFVGGSLTAMFGGITLDLRQAQLAAAGAAVDATAAFGAVKILVPSGWQIAISGLPIFGGYDDKTKSDGPLPADAPVLTVNAIALFGGVEVTHEK
ncbi:MAG TPA: DUF5668 domain-containing protein [Thermomicrobiaceae bacterium]|nr:DUF5668 domain-containing protein [Thermomicrobiaceae bacterium]